MFFWNSLAFSMIQHLRILFSAVFLHVSLLIVQLVLCQMFLMCTHPLPHFFLPDILSYLFSFSFKEKYYFQCSFLPVNCKTSKTNKNKTWILMMMEKEEVFTKDKPTSRKKRLQIQKKCLKENDSEFYLINSVMFSVVLTLLEETS